MTQNFSSSFLIFFYQIALGGLFGLAITPFHELERGFYKSTAGVLFVIAILSLWGKAAFYERVLGDQFSLLTAAELLLHLAFGIAFACYLMSLWGERVKFRARSFACTVLTGLGGLILSARDFYAAPLFSFETVVYPLSFFLSALLLGSVTVGMLIGHWYLIDTGQSLEPFIRVYKFFIAALVAQTAFMFLAGAALYLFGSATSLQQIAAVAARHMTLLSTRIIIGQIAPLCLGWMIWRTLLIPHTMAATGLFYIALLGVFVGEILGRQMLALTSLPF
jgi:hypothetical protein